MLLYVASIPYVYFLGARAGPRWLWRSLVSRLVAEGWTVEQARGAAQRFKDVSFALRRMISSSLPTTTACPRKLSRTIPA
jgi:hypothetical protein